MCFAPQKRTARTLSTFEPPKVVRACVMWCFYVFLRFWLGNTLPRQCLAVFQHINFQKCSDNGALCATTACTFSTSQLPKIVQDHKFLTLRELPFFQTMVCFIILTSKRASRIFVPQRRALFRHLNFQKCSDTEVFLTSCAATACNFSSLICADGSPPAVLLLFDPPESQNIGIVTFLRSCVFFLPTLSLLWLFPPLLFRLSMLSEVWLQNFLRQRVKPKSKSTIYPFGDDVYHPFLVKMGILGNGLSRATGRSCSNQSCNPGAVHDGDPTWGRFAEHEIRRHFSLMFVYRKKVYI